MLYKHHVNLKNMRAFFFFLKFLTANTHFAKPFSAHSLCSCDKKIWRPSIKLSIIEPQLPQRLFSLFALMHWRSRYKSLPNSWPKLNAANEMLPPIESQCLTRYSIYVKGWRMFPYTEMFSICSFCAKCETSAGYPDILALMSFEYD